MTQFAPRLTVALAARNEAARVGRAIESVLAQTFADWELIAIDDGSEDETADVLAAYDDHRIRVIRTSHRGLARSLNLAIHEARGQLLARQDADDVSLPERFGRQLSFLDHNPQVAVVGSAWKEVGPDGREVRPRAAFVPGRVNETLLRFNPLTHTAVMARRDALLRVGGYDESLPFAQDYDLWLRLDATGETLWNLDDVLAVRWMTGENASSRRERAQLRAELGIRGRDLRRRRKAGRPTRSAIRPLAWRTLSLLVPIPLKRALRQHHGKAA